MRAALAALLALFSPVGATAADHANPIVRAGAETLPIGGARADRLPIVRARAERDELRPLVLAEAARQGIPPALADAVAMVETGYDPAATGSSGEVGLMQVMPATAAGLGFRGAVDALFDPATNIRLGVAYLARAWAAADGNPCRALMKYRAGVGETAYSPLSLLYCRRAAQALAATDPDLARQIAATTPGAPTRADPYVVSTSWRARLGELPALAGLPDMVVEPAAPPRPGPAAWHITGTGAAARIQAAVDDALADTRDPHVVRMPPPTQ